MSSNSKFSLTSGFSSEYKDAPQQNAINFAINVNNTIKRSIYYSPIILSICVIILSFLFQTWTGVFFFIFVLFFSTIRSTMIKYMIKDGYAQTFKQTYENCKIKKTDNCPTEWCNINDPEHIGNGFVIFYTIFTVGYILSPMIIYTAYNYYIFVFLLIYLLIIIIYNVRVDYCVSPFVLFLEIIFGVVSVAISIALLVSTNNSKLLFMNALDTNSNFCSMPSSQTFKCSVYKNGELVASSLSK